MTHVLQCCGYLLDRTSEALFYSLQLESGVEFAGNTFNMCSENQSSVNLYSKRTSVRGDGMRSFVLAMLKNGQNCGLNFSCVLNKQKIVYLV